MPDSRPQIAIAFSLLLVLAASPASAAGDDDDWALIGGALSLIQRVVHVAAQTDDPDAARKRVESMLSGEDPEANRLAARMMRDMLEEVPPEQRAAFAAIARDVATLARREQARRPAPPATGAAPAPRVERRAPPDLEIAE